MTTAKTTADELMRSMLSRAEPGPGPRTTLVTEHVGKLCIQVEGRPALRPSRDGSQRAASFHWFLDCRRSSKAKVAAAIEKAAAGMPQ